MTTPRWLVTAAPHLAGRDSTPRIMWNVVLSLVPIVGAAIYFFGLSAILVLAASTLGALVPEWIWGKKRSLFESYPKERRPCSERGLMVLRVRVR